MMLRVGSTPGKAPPAFGAFAETRLALAMAALGITSELQMAFHPADAVYAPQAVTISI